MFADDTRASATGQRRETVGRKGEMAVGKGLAGYGGGWAVDYSLGGDERCNGDEVVTYTVVVDDLGNDGNFSSRWTRVEEDDYDG